MTLWRLHIKTDAREGFDQRRYCIDNNWAGIGWAVNTEDDKPPRDLDHYIELGQQKYAANGYKGWWPAINALAYRMQDEDLCWTRDWNGVYFLGRIKGTWQYLHGQEADNHDVYNIRRCAWAEVGWVDAVPGAVERAFIPSRTLQRVLDPAAIAYSEYLYAVRTGQQPPALPPDLDIFGLFSPLEHEDIAALYLQIERGYAVMPSSAKNSTAAYECVFVRRETGGRAVLQVKSGETGLDIASFGTMLGTVFVVAADGAAYGDVPPNVEMVPRRKLLDFARRHRAMMPKRVQHFMQWSEI